MGRRSGKLGGIIVALCLVIGIPSLFLCVERIPEGYVGVVYSPKNGVENELLGRGWNLVAPWKKVKQFTIGSEQIVLTKDEREGSEEDESFNVTPADDEIWFACSDAYVEAIIEAIEACVETTEE